MFENPLSLIDISNQTTPTQLNELHTANTTRPHKVPIASLRTAQRYFQGRMDGLDVAVKESIYDGLRNNNKIDPIVVFGSADEPVVVDGHHRLAALRGWFHEKLDRKTDVVWVEGDIEDAMDQSFTRNQATSKAYSQKDRMQHGWRALCIRASMGKLFKDDGKGTFISTIKQHQRAFIISDRSAKNLRGQMLRLLRHLEFDLNKLQEELSNDLSKLQDVRWPLGVREAIDCFISGEDLDVATVDFDEDALMQEMKLRLYKAINPAWLSNQYNFAKLNGAFLSLLSNEATADLYEQVAWVVDDEDFKETIHRDIAADKASWGLDDNFDF
jgi:hypothetical protein